LSTTPRSAPDLNWAAAFVLTALAYALAGLAALPLAIPPGYATPLYPAAGVALAAVLLYGTRMLPAVALASFCVNLTLAAQRETLSATAAVVPLLIAIGAALQALIGARLVDRWVHKPLTLSEPIDLLMFFVAAAVSCLTNSLIANVALGATDTVPTEQLAFSLATWWTGDLLGVLIATPIVLTLAGKPRDAWAPRRLSVGLTLVMVTLLLATGIRQVVHWDNERQQTAFDHDAANAAQALATQLREPLQALEALNGMFIASEDVNADEMRLGTRAWLAPGLLQAMTWSVRLQRDDVPAFVAGVRAGGNPRFGVFDRPGDKGGPSAPQSAADHLVVVRHIEPAASNAAALGLNAMSIPATRAALERAERSGEASATAGFRLTQQPESENQLGVVIYQAVYARGVAPEASRGTAMRGAVSVVMRMDDQLRVLKTQLPSYLSLCLLDATSEPPRRRLAGDAGCESRASALSFDRELPFAGRQWAVRITPLPGLRPLARGADVWFFAIVGLLATSTLGGFLLIVTGRTRRIEAAVLERPPSLQAEVHERKAAEAALRESEQRFRNILNNVPIGVVYSDLTGIVREINPRFCELTGYTADALKGRTLADLTHPVDLPQDTALTAQLVRGEIPMYRRHTRYVTQAGATVWVRATVSLLRDANSAPLSIVGVVEDITEHLQLEEAERAREAAEVSNRAKSEFLSRMSHELRTPLNAMLGFAQLLELDARQPLTDSQRPWVGQIQQAGWHLLEMINDVLDLSRIDSGNLSLKLSTLSLPKVLEASVAMVAGAAAQRGIVISHEFSPNSATVQGDSTRLKQILTNVLSNAVKYNIEGGRVHIGCRAVEPGSVEVAVTDTGLGMTPEQLAQLFQPFNRLGRERTSHEGTGIGLVISQRLAELMGGSLVAHSIDGEGSVFVLTLPRAPDPDSVRSDLDALPAEAPGYQRRIVHYVEDNETNVEVMRGILAQRPQVALQVSITGLEGLAAIRATRPDLILLDMHLPDLTGMELLQRLQADDLTAGIPVVMVSADALADQIEAAFQAGCTHYLTKPVSVVELLAVVDRLLEIAETRFG
jgi:PAS domain S-box-containing protein